MLTAGRLLIETMTTYGRLPHVSVVCLCVCVPACVKKHACAKKRVHVLRNVRVRMLVHGHVFSSALLHDFTFLLHAQPAVAHINVYTRRNWRAAPAGVLRVLVAHEREGSHA